MIEIKQNTSPQYTINETSIVLTSPEWPFNVAIQPLEFFMSLSFMSHTLIEWSAPPLYMYGPLAEIARMIPLCPLKLENQLLEICIIKEIKCCKNQYSVSVKLQDLCSFMLFYMDSRGGMY